MVVQLVVLAIKHEYVHHNHSTLGTYTPPRAMSISRMLRAMVPRLSQHQAAAARQFSSALPASPFAPVAAAMMPAWRQNVNPVAMFAAGAAARRVPSPLLRTMATASGEDALTKVISAEVAFEEETYKQPEVGLRLIVQRVPYSPCYRCSRHLLQDGSLKRASPIPSSNSQSSMARKPSGCGGTCSHLNAVHAHHACSTGGDRRDRPVKG